MLVIGFQADLKAPFHSELEIDVDVDSPRKIHDLLSKKANGASFTHVICIENDGVVAEFEDETDYDLSDAPSTDDDADDEDDELNPDSLHEDGDDTDTSLDDLDGD
jgi:hypothetical protein